MTKMDMVWVVVATLLQPQTDEDTVVTKAQIDESVNAMFGETITPVMITRHLVNSVDRQADRDIPERGGSRNRYLFRDADGGYRLYKSQDHGSDAWEKTGPTHPDPNKLGAVHVPLVAWYQEKYFNA